MGQKRADAKPVLEYRDPEMRDTVIVQRIRGTQYSVVAGSHTLELTRAEAVQVAKAILKDAYAETDHESVKR